MNEKLTHSGENIIFVGGTPRSGTTMIQNILDSHPEILGLPEFFLNSEIMTVREKLHYFLDKNFINDICNYEQVDRSINEFIYSYFEPHIKRSQCRYISEKTAHNVIVFDHLLEIFPKAKFVFCVRDPRGLMASFFIVREKGKKQGMKTALYTRSIRAGIEFIKECQGAGFRAAEKYPGRVYTIQYEKVVSDPKSETKKICKFLEIPWSRAMTTPAQFKHMGERGITQKRNNMYYDKKMFNRNPETSRIEAWKEKLTPTQQVRVSNAFKDDKNLKKLGYDFSLGHLPSTTRLKGEVLSGVRKRIGDLRLAVKERI